MPTGSSLEKGKPGTAYNICTGTRFSIKEILDMLIDISGVKVEVRTDKGRLRPSDVPLLQGDNSLFTGDTGWKPEIPMEKTWPIFSNSGGPARAGADRRTERQIMKALVTGASGFVGGYLVSRLVAERGRGPRSRCCRLEDDEAPAKVTAPAHSRSTASCFRRDFPKKAPR